MLINMSSDPAAGNSRQPSNDEDEEYDPPGLEPRVSEPQKTFADIIKLDQFNAGQNVQTSSLLREPSILSRNIRKQTVSYASPNFRASSCFQHLSERDYHCCAIQQRLERQGRYPASESYRGLAMGDERSDNKVAGKSLTCTTKSMEQQSKQSTWRTCTECFAAMARALSRSSGRLGLLKSPGVATVGGVVHGVRWKPRVIFLTCQVCRPAGSSKESVITGFDL